MQSVTRSSNPLLVLFLLSLSAYAFYATWGNSLLDGTLNRMLDILGADIPLISGTNEPLRLHFTGVAPIDYWFTIMVLFFWEAVDGSHPATSLTGIYFLGQLVGVWTLVYVEGNRIENKGLIVSRTLLWTLLMQNLTLACFGPIYFVIHLETSPTVRSTSVTNEAPLRILAAARNLQFLPFSIILGYVVPSILLGLPSPNLVSHASQQAAIAIWTPFPVWVGLAQLILTWCDAKLSASKSSAVISSAESHGIYMRALRLVYLFALVGSAFVHIGTIVTSLSTLLFPAIFASGVQSEFAPANLLFPKNSQTGTIGAGVLNFMQWDQWIGYTALLAWVLNLEQGDQKLAARTWNVWLWHGLEIILPIALLGPGGAAVLFVWRRDEIRWSAEQQSVRARQGK